MLQSHVEKLLKELHFKTGVKGAELLALDPKDNFILGMSFARVEQPALFTVMLLDHLKICNAQNVVPKLLLPDSLSKEWGHHTWKMTPEQQEVYYQDVYSQWAAIYGMSVEQLQVCLQSGHHDNNTIYYFHNEKNLQFQMIRWKDCVTSDVIDCIKDIESKFDTAFEKLKTNILNTQLELGNLLSTFIQEISPAPSYLAALKSFEAKHLNALFRIIFAKTFEGMTPIIITHYSTDNPSNAEAKIPKIRRIQGHFTVPSNFLDIRNGFNILRNIMAQDEEFQALTKRSFFYLLTEALTLPNILLNPGEKTKSFKSILAYLTLKPHKTGPMEYVVKNILKPQLEHEGSLVGLISAPAIYDSNFASVDDLTQDLTSKLSSSLTTTNSSASNAQPPLSRESTPEGLDPKDEEDTRTSAKSLSIPILQQQQKESVDDLTQDLTSKLSSSLTTTNSSASSAQPPLSRESTPEALDPKDEEDTGTSAKSLGIPIFQSQQKELDSTSEDSGSPPSSFEAKVPHLLVKEAIPLVEAPQQTPTALNPFHLDSTIVNASSSEAAEKNPATSKAILFAQLSAYFMDSLLQKFGTKDNAAVAAAFRVFVDTAGNILASSERQGATRRAHVFSSPTSPSLSSQTAKLSHPPPQ